MKRLFRRDLLLLAVISIVMIALLAFIAQRRLEQEANAESSTSYSSHSAFPTGTLALYLWLEQLGYRPQRIEDRAFEIDPGVRALYVISPIDELTPDQAGYILDWVARGNILIAADGGFFSRNGLFTELDIVSEPIGDQSDDARLAQPLLDTATDDITTDSFFGLELEDSAYVPYLMRDDVPLFVKIPHGQGTLWLSSAPDLFTNRNLSNPNNAKLVLAMLSELSPGSIIAFDEYHLGRGDPGGNSLVTLVFNTPWGWGILLGGFAVFAYLIINGRRFGRTVPVRRTLQRRAPSEYVVSMANLFRRANKRGMVLQHYRHSLKRRLGRPFHLNPELADDRYLELLSRMRPELDRAELTQLLNSLRRSDATEADLVKTIEHAVTFGTRRQA